MVRAGSRGVWSAGDRAVTAKLNGVDPRGWLAHVPNRTADHEITRIDELLPWRYLATAA